MVPPSINFFVCIYLFIWFYNYVLIEETDSEWLYINLTWLSGKMVRSLWSPDFQKGLNGIVNPLSECFLILNGISIYYVYFPGGTSWLKLKETLDIKQIKKRLYHVGRQKLFFFSIFLFKRW